MDSNFKLYTFVLEPKSAFSTPFQGDTLFGMFVWQCAYNNEILNVTFEKFLEDYRNNNPYVIFSSALYYKNENFYFKKPNLVNEIKENIDDRLLKKNIKDRKLEKKKNYFGASKSEIMSNFFISYKKDNCIELKTIDERRVTRNKINRLTFTTGDGEFSPYIANKSYVGYGYDFAIFVLVDESKIKFDKLSLAIENIGKQGVGKDASIGMGQFKIKESFECKNLNNNTQMYYTLSPFVYGDDNDFCNISYEPITKYGKHGGLAVLSGNPFKNPILMIDEGAIFTINEGNQIKKNYIGRALNNISKQFDGKVVHQGFSIIIPFKNEVV